MNKDQIKQKALKLVIDSIANIHIDYADYDCMDDAFDVINEINRINIDLEFDLRESLHEESLDRLIERAKEEGMTLRKVSMGDAHFQAIYDCNELIESYWEVIDRDGVLLRRAHEDDAVEFVQGVLELKERE